MPTSGRFAKFAFTKAHPREFSASQILRAVENGQLFGMVEVDICVLEHWPEGHSYRNKNLNPFQHFAEMTSLFCTSSISHSKIGRHMQQHAEQNDLGTKPRALLVGVEG